MFSLVEVLELSAEHVTFSFGKNWQDFLKGVSDTDISSAKDDIREWLGDNAVAGKSVIDVGSGSGIHSLAFVSLGAKSVHSFDYDPHSVAATTKVHASAGSPPHWKVEHGSVLDEKYVRSLGQFDIVYSWGVLHHTGSMWKAVENCASLVAPGGTFWIALYQKGPKYPSDLALKRRYNSASDLGKRWMITKWVVRLMLGRLKNAKNPFAWNEQYGRGMNVYHDLVDWLGGLPYEVAGEDEVVKFGRKKGFILERIKVEPEGACSMYVFSVPRR
jgi:2-polyprenyl-6-hydroxyphenyl methylase/3-demethylubiquinone-9 3-methyltransferase